MTLLTRLVSPPLPPTHLPMQFMKCAEASEVPRVCTGEMFNINPRMFAPLIAPKNPTVGGQDADKAKEWQSEIRPVCRYTLWRALC